MMKLLFNFKNVQKQIFRIEHIGLSWDKVPILVN